VTHFHNEEHFKELCGYTIDGIWYPRVTKIVEIKAKPALYKFYAELGAFQAGEDIKTKAATEGTLIHETFEKILLGESPAIDPSIEPSIKAAVSFVAANHIQVLPEFVEKRVVNANHRYAGTVDTLALIDGKFGVLDIKTSQSIYRDYNLQTSAYMDALKDQFKNIQTRWIMRIDQNKTCQTCGSILRSKGGRDKIRDPYPRPKGWQCCPDNQHLWGTLKGVIELREFPYWQEDFQAFLGAKKLWEWENQNWLQRVGYLS
jgi:hypothetical protein